MFRDYVDPRLKRVPIDKKGSGIIALKFIPKNTVILKETPAFTLPPGEKIVSDIFQLLYQIFTADDEKIRLFLNYQPKTSENFRHHQNAVQKELLRLKNSQYHHIYTFFKENYTNDEILLFAAKYMCNGFDPHCILFKGAELNHSCLPNVVFYLHKDQFWFKAVRDIQAGEEICDSYGDITENRKTRQRRLKDQYGFVCQCARCVHEDETYYDAEAKKIARMRLTS